MAVGFNNTHMTIVGDTDVATRTTTRMRLLLGFGCRVIVRQLYMITVTQTQITNHTSSGRFHRLSP